MQAATASLTRVALPTRRCHRRRPTAAMPPVAAMRPTTVRYASRRNPRRVSCRAAQLIACAVAGLCIHDIDRTTHHWSWSCPPNLLSPCQWGKLAGQPTPADSDTNVASGAEHYDSIVYIDAPSDKSLSHACPTCALIKPYLTRRAYRSRSASPRMGHRMTDPNHSHPHPTTAPTLAPRRCVGWAPCRSARRRRAATAYTPGRRA